MVQMKKFVKPKVCPLCKNQTKKHKLISQKVYGDKKPGGKCFIQCDRCDVIYLYPPLSTKEQADFYNLEFEKFMADRAGDSFGWDNSEKHILANESTRTRRMNFISKYIRPESRILEIGCSSGFMLIPLMKDGHITVGVEPSGYFLTEVLSRGIACYESLEKLLVSSEPMFDIIMHFFVLEHISDPATFILDGLSKLKQGGVMLFEIPCAYDALYKLYDNKEFGEFYWSIAHSWYFSYDSIAFLLDKLGLQYTIIPEQRYDLSNHLVWLNNGLPGGMERYTSVLGPELEESYKNQLIKAGYYDTLMVSIRKDQA